LSLQQPEKEHCGTSEVSAEQHQNKKINLFHRLHLEGRHDNKLRAADVLRLTSVHALQSHESCAEEELSQTFIQKLLMMNYRARYIKYKETNEESHNEQGTNDSCRQEADSDDFFFNIGSLPNEGISKSERIHPMDLQMAVEASP